MSDFLETLKRGMQEAQQKYSSAQQKLTAAQAEFQLAQQRLAVAQTEFQTAIQEFQAFQTLVNLQTHKQQGTSGATPVTAPAHVLVPQHSRILITPGQPVPNIPPTQPSANGNRIESNKTQAVRDLLRQHPAGMTPAEIWEQLETQLSTRAYLYSVLKRLRDKKDAKEKRGKYFLIPKPEENQGQTAAQ